jgi:cytochrome oxidase Cu insertion factor (SCO1/SenC/PrrC family)
MIGRMFLPLVVTLAVVAVVPVGGTHAVERRAAQRRGATAAKEDVLYSCPMHPEVVSSKPGKCPKCGLALRRVERAEQTQTTTTTTTTTPAAPAPNAHDESAPPKIPDVHVLDQSGKPLNFYTDLVKGKTVAINFIFTTCTAICPPMTATFRRVQQLLGERLRADVRLISVSVDPATDTPERLSAFAAKFKADAGWTFVTGDKAEIDKLLAALGASVADKNDHTPIVLIVNDAAGAATRTYGLAPPAALAKIITEIADRK